MSTMFFSSMLIFIMANILMTLAMFLSKKSFMEREKLSSFECGFDQKSSSRIPFSLHFFLITIIFLIFDIEIALILPSICTLKISPPSNWFIINMIFILILIIGIIHEWNQNMINWAK